MQHFPRFNSAQRDAVMAELISLRAENERLTGEIKLLREPVIKVPTLEGGPSIYVSKPDSVDDENQPNGRFDLYDPGEDVGFAGNDKTRVSDDEIDRRLGFVDAENDVVYVHPDGSKRSYPFEKKAE